MIKLTNCMLIYKIPGIKKYIPKCIHFCLYYILIPASFTINFHLTTFSKISISNDHISMGHDGIGVENKHGVKHKIHDEIGKKS